jgi:hypothetical protein
MCLLVCVPLLLQSSRLLWLSLVSYSASLGKSYTGKLILKILRWWICLTFWVFVISICALVVWDFSYVMMVVCCFILLIVPVVLVAGEWKEYGFIVWTGRKMAYKGTNWVEAYFYISSVKELLTEVEQFLWASHEMDPICSFSWAAQFVVSPPLSHQPLFAVQYT